jgi:NodT family efflux transporter outer membrane factor (OMF) lipoprotein
MSERALSTGRTLLAATLLAACSAGPNFHRPAAPQATAYMAEPPAPATESADIPGGEAQRFVQDLDIPGQWWTLFQSEPLNSLIAASIEANPDLRAAQSALRVALENVYAQRGAYYPSLQASFTPTRQNNPAPVSSPAATPQGASAAPNIFTFYTSQLSVFFALDVFGLNRRQVENFRAQADVQRFALEATYLTLTANVVGAAVQEASLRAQIAATQEILDSERQALGLLQRQYDLGQIAMADVVAERTAIAQTEETLPPLQKQLAQQRFLLSILAGGLPNQERPETFELSSLHLPQELPLSLPSKLVEQRPDVRQAEANLHATSALIGVAVANRLPNFNITAAEGGTANHASDILQQANLLWNLTGVAAQPIFQGFTLMHRQRAAQAAYQQAAAQYRSTLATALEGVANALYAIESDATALKAASDAETSANESLQITRRQLEIGSVSYLALLTAQQAQLQTRITRVQAQANRYADTAALFQALGGGWWNRTDVSENY